MGILQEKVYKTCITDLDELKQRLRTERAKLDHASLRQPFANGVVDSCRSLKRALYTSFAIFPAIHGTVASHVTNNCTADGLISRLTHRSHVLLTE